MSDNNNTSNLIPNPLEITHYTRLNYSIDYKLIQFECLIQEEINKQTSKLRKENAKLLKESIALQEENAKLLKEKNDKLKTSNI